MSQYLYEESAKEKIRKSIAERTQDDKERKRLFGLLKGNKWVNDSYLRRKMRQHKKHGKTNVQNQIILEYGVYGQFKGKDGKHGSKFPLLQEVNPFQSLLIQILNLKVV